MPKATCKYWIFLSRSQKKEKKKGGEEKKKTTQFFGQMNNRVTQNRQIPDKRLFSVTDLPFYGQLVYLKKSDPLGKK